MPNLNPPSYTAHLLVALASLFGSIHRRDKYATFNNTSSVRAFRKGVLEVVDEAWWMAKLGEAKDRPCARALKERVERDAVEVGKAWLESRGRNSEVSVCTTVFCETILGTAVYKAVAGRGLVEDETMYTLGEIYGALLQSIALPNHVVEAPAGFSFINGVSHTRYFLVPISAIVDLLYLSHDSHASAPSALARNFCRGVEAILPDHDWDALDVAARQAIRHRLQEDHVQVAAVLPAQAPTPHDLFTVLLGPVVCGSIPPTSEGNVVELGKTYGSLLKSLAFPRLIMGHPTSTFQSLAHPLAAAAGSW
ncbi:hypothetical protein RTBOTA2_005937 [Rhodotorula toruloides]|nr:hypothetical protein RTBOTA2_005937 [Rhodotorula toruloides]